jgi:hypothetical protein
MLLTPTTITPGALADVLTDLLAGTEDREVAAILTTARESLRALAWNRYAAKKTSESQKRSFIRHHKNWRSARA